MIIHLLSTLSSEITIPPISIPLFEMMIVNATTKTAKIGVYIPTMDKCEVWMSFHINNFDEQVQRFDEKKTVHYFLIVCFQRGMSEFKLIEPNLEKKTSLKLKENSFANILLCDKPSNHQLLVVPQVLSKVVAQLFVQQCFWSIEHLPAKDEVATYVSDDMGTKFYLIRRN